MSNRAAEMDPSNRATEVDPRLTILQSITIKLWAVVEFHVPVGYEDETGFHFGEPVFDWEEFARN